MRHLLIVTAGFGLALCPSTVLAGPNLVTNGSFESGLAGWTVSGDSTTPAPAVIAYGTSLNLPAGAVTAAIPPADNLTSSPDAAGRLALAFTTNFADAPLGEGYQAISQNVLIPGKGFYKFGMSVYVPGFVSTAPISESFLYLLPTFGFNILNRTLTSARDEWIDISSTGYFPILLPYNYDLTVEFTGQKNTTGIAVPQVVDQVFLMAVPEPSSWTMLVAGFGIVGFAARRRRGRAVAA
jgi:hypothetical protein